MRKLLCACCALSVWIAAADAQVSPGPHVASDANATSEATGVGQGAGTPIRNSLVIVDTFANVRRIEALVQSLDVGEPYKLQPCDPTAK
jgi:hypothetical protein